MADSQLNSALHSISGAIDQWVYRQFRGRTIISRRPDAIRDPTAGQLAVRERFRLAAKYATETAGNPVLVAQYEAIASKRKVPVREVMMTDYLRPPVVESVSLADFHGEVGHPIVVSATDDVGVMSVSIAIRDADQTVLEEGPATLLGGAWVYAATVAHPTDTPVTITATAVDRPGNKGTLTVNWGPMAAE